MGGPRTRISVNRTIYLVTSHVVRLSRAPRAYLGGRWRHGSWSDRKPLEVSMRQVSALERWGSRKCLMRANPRMVISARKTAAVAGSMASLRKSIPVLTLKK